MTTVHVTQEHINQGVKGDCIWCPIARALRDAFPDRFIHVGRVYAAVGNDCLALSRLVVEFISNFDKGQCSGPFSFEVDL